MIYSISIEDKDKFFDMTEFNDGSRVAGGKLECNQDKVHEALDKLKEAVNDRGQ